MSVLRLYRYFRSIPFVRDIVLLQIGKVAYMGLTFISSVVFARWLGLEHFGTYAVTLALVSTARALTNLGQSAALQVFFAEEYGKRSIAGMASVLRNFCQLALLNGIILILFAMISPIIAEELYGSATIGFYARWLFLYGAIDIVNGGFLVILQAIRQVRFKVILEESAIAAFVCAACISLFLGYGIAGIVQSQLAVSIAFAPLSIILYARLARRESLPSFADIVSAPFRSTIPYITQGMLFSIDKNIGSLYPSGLFFVLSLVAPTSSVGLARIALQLATLPQSFLLPQVSELSTTVLATMSQNAQALRKNAAKVIKHSLFFHLLISIAALIAIPFLIRIFYGKEYMEAIPLTLALIMLSLLSPLTIINSPLLRLFRRIHYSLIVVIVTMVAMWGCIYALTPILGPEGSFLFAYFLGQVLPLSLTGYVFLVLLRR